MITFNSSESNVIFNDWADHYFHDGRLNRLFTKLDAIDDFRKSRYSVTHQGFKRLLKHWCDFYGYEFNPPALINDNYSNRILKRVDGDMHELYYIRTKSAPLNFDLPGKNTKKTILQRLKSLFK